MERVVVALILAPTYSLHPKAVPTMVSRDAVHWIPCRSHACTRIAIWAGVASISPYSPFRLEVYVVITVDWRSGDEVAIACAEAARLGQGVFIGSCGSPFRLRECSSLELVNLYAVCFLHLAFIGRQCLRGTLRLLVISANFFAWRYHGLGCLL